MVCKCTRWGGILINISRFIRRRRSFHGGLFLPVRGWPVSPVSIMDFSCPPVLCVPMVQHDGPASRVVVEVGREVKAGELIGRAEAPGSLNVHAPFAGKVTGVCKVDTASAFEVPAVRIETSGQGNFEAGDGDGSRSLEGLDIEGLVEVAEAAGLTDFGRPALGLADKLARAGSAQVSDIIINAIPAERMLSAKKLILAEYFEDILTAAGWLHGALGAGRIWLAVDRADRELVNRCRSGAGGKAVRVIDLPNKYPQGSPILLTKVIAGHEVPYGGSTLDVGVLVLELELLAGLVGAVRGSGPMVDRLVTVAGPAAKNPGNYRIPVGTRYADVLECVSLADSVVRIVEGGLMTGRVIGSLDAVVTKQTSAIILLGHDTDRIPNPGPCIHCGWCQEDCPVGLDPQALLDVLERDRRARAGELYPHACIDCGLCSYVCPAELPLAEAVMKLKELVPIDV